MPVESSTGNTRDGALFSVRFLGAKYENAGGFHICFRPPARPRYGIAIFRFGKAGLGLAYRGVPWSYEMTFLGYMR